MRSAILVFFGAGIGGVFRHLTNQAWLKALGPNVVFPYATFTVNALGSFIMGVLVAFFAFRAGAAWSQPARLFMTTGILGGYTTFSAFSLDAALLIEKGQSGLAVAYVLASVALSIGALFAGLALVRNLL